MEPLTTDQARAGEVARAMGAKPLGYAVVDAGGHLLALARDERAGFLRATIAANKAWGCMALGISGARLEQVVKGWESWFVGIQGAASGRLVPTPGGVIIRSAAGDRLGAVGISGESSAQRSGHRHGRHRGNRLDRRQRR